ncbi:phage virion morphogenesis protein [Tsukamurella spumae]|uniref:Phage virion morphogenesis protein n=1 Tax=Tsukamurella spumae TaxID=44753 RepID=A0A846X3U1_9ACTN|nr:phage virion morphogenesis protein [Tsukamurella spumae]NKY18862.1 hypothetical protein [Tsukamurella spumae]
MTATTLSVEVEGADEVALALRRIGADVHDLKPVMSDVGDYLKDFFAGEVFASRGGVIGHPWARLSPVYAAQKARKYAGRGVLVATGEMQRSFISNAAPMQVEITNTARHFVYHQSDAARRILPYRPMMDVRSGDTRYDRIVEMLVAHVAKAIKENT